jgi:hypothetical protein
VVTFVSVPQVAPEQPAPDKAQVTPLLAESFCTAAMKPEDCEICTEADGGFTETETGGGAAVIVIVAAADFVLSAIEVAVKVTVAGAGTFAGAL